MAAAQPLKLRHRIAAKTSHAQQSPEFVKADDDLEFLWDLLNNCRLNLTLSLLVVDHLPSA